MSEERAFMREAVRELRAEKEEAVAAWLACRHKIGALRWTDKDALRAVRISVERALVQEEWRDVLAAVRACALTPITTPWNIPGEAAEIGSARREADHHERMVKEREQGFGSGV